MNPTISPRSGRFNRPERRRTAFAGPLVVLMLAVQTLVATGQATVPAEGDGREALHAALQSEIERAGTALAAVQGLREGLAAAQAGHEASARDALDRAAAKRLALDREKAGSATSDRLYDEAVEDIVRERAALRAALDELARPSGVPHFELQLDLGALRGARVGDQLTRLESLQEQVTHAELEARRLEEQNRRALVALRWDVVRRLNDVRVLALGRMSDARRARVLGISREGVAQLRRELGHLALGARAHVVTRWYELVDLRPHLRDVFSLGAAAWVLVKILAVIVLYLFLRGRGPAIRRWTREALFDKKPRIGPRTRPETILAAAETAAPWVLLLLALGAGLWALGRAAGLVEVQIAYRLAVLFVLYRLGIRLVRGGLVGLVGRHGVEVSAGQAARVEAGVRALLRIGFAVAVSLLLASRFVGRGYLYHGVIRLAVVALAVFLLVVFLRWRRDIVGAYLARDPGGWLGRKVRQSRESWYGGFVAAVALAALAGRALVAIAGEFAMGFDQTRRALAFLFRRRVEKQAELTGYAEPDAERRLPPGLLEALSEAPVDRPQLTLEYFPGHEELHAALEAWKETRVGGSFLLTGDYGIGRTSWLANAKLEGLPVQHVTFEERIDSTATLGRVLGSALELGECTDEDALGARLAELPPRVIVIDRGQNLFLGKVGGYAGFESFMSLVDSTASHVFWLVAFSQLAWDHVAAVHPHLASFRHYVALEPWPEEKIRELIDLRAKVAGVEVVYDDLVLDASGARPGRARAEEMAEGYSRMLWDQCLGLPRIALNYWKRSLVPETASRFRVRLFVPPPVEQIERAGDVPLFLLASISVHESLTVAEMATTTRYSLRLCRIHVARLQDLGVIRPIGERYWVTPYWQPVVARLLKRHNMLSD